MRDWWQSIYDLLLAEREGLAYMWGSPNALDQPYGYSHVTKANIPCEPLRTRLASACRLLDEFIAKLADDNTQPSDREQRRVLREVITTKLSEGETARRQELMQASRLFARGPSTQERKWVYDTYHELGDHDEEAAGMFGPPDEDASWDERLRRLRHLLEVI